MKYNLKTAIVTALVMCLVLGNVPFRAMLVCVHGGGDHGEGTVHLHYGQLPGQPCHESPEELSLSTVGDGPRHFTLGQETLNKPKPPVKNALDLFLPVVHALLGATGNFPANIRGGCPFDDPSFVFLDTAFTPTTVLIL